VEPVHVLGEPMLMTSEGARISTASGHSSDYSSSESVLEELARRASGGNPRVAAEAPLARLQTVG